MTWFRFAVAVHLLVLYAPRSPSPSTGLPLDKLVHALIFGAVLWTALRAGLPAVPVAAVLVAHAVVSEAVQGALLPGRSADPGDAVADVAGVALAALARILVRRRVRGTPVHGPGTPT